MILGIRYKGVVIPVDEKQVEFYDFLSLLSCENFQTLVQGGNLDRTHQTS